MPKLLTLLITISLASACSTESTRADAYSERDSTGIQIIESRGPQWRPDQLRWTVFDTNGRWLGTVMTPSRFTIYEIGSDFVLGRAMDDMDTERVLMYRLLKQAAR